MEEQQTDVAKLLAAIADDDRAIWPWAILITLVTTLVVCFFALAGAASDNIPLHEWPPNVVAELIGRELVLSTLVGTFVWLPFSLFAFSRRSISKKMMALGMAVAVSIFASVWMRYAIYQRALPVEFHNGVVERVNALQAKLDADFDRVTFVPILGGNTTPGNVGERLSTTRTSIALLSKFQQDMSEESAGDHRELAALSISAADRSALNEELADTFAAEAPGTRRAALTLIMFQKAEIVLALLKAHQNEWHTVNAQIAVAPGPTRDQLAKAISDYQSAAAALRPFSQPNVATSPPTPQN